MFNKSKSIIILIIIIKLIKSVKKSLHKKSAYLYEILLIIP